MKKIFIFVSLCFLLTGCGNTLKCVSSADNDLSSFKRTYKIKYSNDLITNVNDVQIFKLKDESIRDNFEMSVIFARGSIEQYGVKYDYIGEDNKSVIDVNYDIGELSEEAFDNLIGTRSVNEFRKQLEQNGFKCK